ncbi:MAG: LLM class flavin-dependent oxidoreductase [Sphingomonadales bacterium]|nr:LLM class flavin-dependent oxidoreductase [Sphingomonadales bacterium]
MARMSFLDLVPVLDGGSLGDAFLRAGDIAAHCEALGFSRYWVAEHHGMPGVGGAATSVVLAHVGAATRHLRIGAGGIMLPNHAPLQIAEQFGTLDALFPGRIDLGLGRAPGSEGRVAYALRRSLAGGSDNFVADIRELQGYFAGASEHGFEAVPGAGADVALWILGSSTFGAQVAAALGLPYAFASHFAPQMIDAALAAYRAHFRPSAVLDKPRVMVGCNVFAADDAQEARWLASSMQQAFVALRSGETRGGLKPPVEGYWEGLPAPARAMLAEAMRFAAIGTRDDVAGMLRMVLARTGADEVIVTSQIFDHRARKRSIAIAAEAMAALSADA